MNILIAEDDPDIREILADALQEQGYMVTCAYDGEDAFRKLGSSDLLLTDWMMPHLSGLQLIRKIRATNSQVYVIVVTAKTKHDNMLEALLEGADDYVPKPFDLNQLLDRVELARDTIALRKQE